MANNISFYYDPQRQGYDTTLWKTLSGVPSVATNYIVLSEAAIIHYADLYQARVIYDVIIPAAPTLGDERAIGLAQVNNGDFVGFKIVDDVFSVTSNNSETSKSVVIAWKAIWSNTSIKLEIRWKGYKTEFFINGVKVATISSSTDPVDGNNDNGLVLNPTSLYVANGNADDLSIVSINALDISQFI